MEERDYYVGFSLFSGIGPARFQVLLDYFKSAQQAWEASPSDLKKAGIGALTTLKFDKFRNEFSIKNYIQKLNNNKVSFLARADSSYPKLLFTTKKPPIVLYTKGTIDFNSLSIGIVGSRKVTSYGREVTQLITQELASQGFTIVSGLALGVDAIAHETALENGGKTIAVLGCGVDCCTPRENSSLYNQIIQKGGAVISELPLGHPPTKGSFPSRNRIIAGLSVGVVVTEGAEDSGSLISADYAFKFGRPVFAVPGPITSSLSKGPYKLISRGAKLVTSAHDIINELTIRGGSRIPASTQRLASTLARGEQNSELRIKKADTKEKEMILELLFNEPLHFDQLVKQTGVDAAKLGSMLSIMEIKGIIVRGENSTFRLIY